MDAVVAAGREKLLPLDTLKEQLAISEPLGVIPISEEAGTSVVWRFDPAWALTLATTHGTSPVAARLHTDVGQFTLTKDAVLTAVSAFGLPGKHAAELPYHLLEQEMNYWFAAGLGKREFNLLTVGGDTAAAFVKATKQPFSNLRLLEAIEGAIRRRMGQTEILVDFKHSHSLSKTDYRLIIPELEHEIDSPYIADVWSAGVAVTNSLIAKTQTAIDPYLFRWLETSGATSQLGTTGTWNRRTQGQEEHDVLAWAAREVDAILDAAGTKWAELQKLTSVSIESNAQDILREVFKTYGV